MNEVVNKGGRPKVKKNKYVVTLSIKNVFILTHYDDEEEARVVIKSPNWDDVMRAYVKEQKDGELFL